MQGEIFAAEGYAKVTGDVGVCIATSGPGATNLVTGLADALLDSVPMVAITGQVPRKMIGTDAFQETPIVEVTRQITKHNYLVMDIQVNSLKRSISCCSVSASLLLLQQPTLRMQSADHKHLHCTQPASCPYLPCCLFAVNCIRTIHICASHSPYCCSTHVTVG